nr:replication protein A 70 kDa DNA-binding subunit D-like [Ipomoea batatas]
MGVESLGDWYYISCRGSSCTRDCGDLDGGGVLPVGSPLFGFLCWP